MAAGTPRRPAVPVCQIDLPADSRALSTLARVDYTDAFTVHPGAGPARDRTPGSGPAPSSRAPPHPCAVSSASAGRGWDCG